MVSGLGEGFLSSEYTDYCSRRDDSVLESAETAEEFHLNVDGAAASQSRMGRRPERSRPNLVLVAEKVETYRTDVVMDRETLTAYLETILSERPCAPDCMAQVLVRFKEAIEGGKEGIARALNSLADGIELMYLRTDVHKAALKLYILSQMGFVKPHDEPLALLTPALERSLAEVEQTRRRETSKKKLRRSA